MLLQTLCDKNLISPPSFLPANTVYLVLMGSEAYGVASGDSDWDVYGFCVPKKLDVFPHLAGEIVGFGRKKNRFDVWQQHHVDDAETGRQYDFAVYSIIKYFGLVIENNPNMIDSLYVPQRCVLHSTAVGEMVREKRDIFLHKGCWHKFRGYAYQSLYKAKEKKLNRFATFCKSHNVPMTVTLEQVRDEINAREQAKQG